MIEKTDRTSSGEVINRVSQSGIISIDLEEFYPKEERVLIDLKENLHEGLILKEKDFREFIKNKHWEEYKNKYVAITCSTDAIIPTWAFMLVASKATPFAKKVVYGNMEILEQEIFHDQLSQINPQEYKNARVVVKGCSKFPVPSSAYVEITSMLTPFVSSLMFGEPCSTVPVFKKPKNLDKK